MSRETNWFVLWGKKLPTDHPVFIKLAVGTLSECGQEHKRRKKEGGWVMVITAKGEKPNE